jgi:sulfur carrier protein ThiS
VAEALARLAERPELGELLDRMPVAMAVNRDYADPGTSLAAGDELALVPPVSGGSGDANVHARVTDEPLSLEQLSRLVSRPAAGAIVASRRNARSAASTTRPTGRCGGEDRRSPRLDRYGLERWPPRTASVRSRWASRA